MLKDVVKGVVIASAVGALFASGAALAEEKAEKAKSGATVQCAGINGCKGQGACAGADNGCKGTNSCKGQGWVETSAKECKAKGGKVMEEKKS
ncbi:MAG TPA: hypothetical protein VFP50_00760 [Anaeromyxobacteraceae bacterium]|nr:hypothetical protein [Anaeromyxobacteraceae bacterium]